MMTKFYFVVGLAMLASGTSLLAQNDQLHTALDKLVVEQTEKWGKVIRAANIKAE